MWFLNKETGLKWEVENKDLIERLKYNEAYEIIDEDSNEKTPNKKQIKK